MEQTELIFIGLAVLVINLWIIYEIIKSAVRSANKDMDNNLRIQNRLLIKQLEKMGVSKDELVKLYHQDTDTFWNSIKE